MSTSCLSGYCTNINVSKVSLTKHGNNCNYHMSPCHNNHNYDKLQFTCFPNTRRMNKHFTKSVITGAQLSSGCNRVGQGRQSELFLLHICNTKYFGLCPKAHGLYIRQSSHASVTTITCDMLLETKVNVTQVARSRD